MIMPNGEPYRFETLFIYEPRTPNSVVISFSVDNYETVEVSIDRTMLADGVSKGAHHHDLRIWADILSDPGILSISMQRPGVTGLFEFSLPKIIGFLDMTFRCVPDWSATIYPTLDAEIITLMAAGG
jgi:hypothetical protein